MTTCVFVIVYVDGEVQCISIMADVQSVLNENKRNVSWNWIGSECASSYIVAVNVRVNQTSTYIVTRTTDNFYHLPFLIEAYETTNIKTHVSAINMFGTVGSCICLCHVHVVGELARLACFVSTYFNLR